MDLHWISNEAVEDDDVTKHLQHYLIDAESSRCLAIIVAPRRGNLLYVTDLRIPGQDRYYMNLTAAKEYCESVAELNNISESEDLEKQVALIKAKVKDGEGKEVEAT